VLRVNSAARRLYERLGFVVTGSTPVHDYLEYLPSRPGPPELLAP
jgi:hypothetical protein